MYLMATHIPIYTDGERKFLDYSWCSDVELACEYFTPHFGKLKLIGPSCPRELAENTQLVEIEPDREDLSLHPSIDVRTSIRQFWPGASRQWHQDLAPLLEEATVVHASIDDCFRPMQLATMRAALKANKATVLVGFDMDLWELFRVQLKQMSFKNKVLHIARTIGMDFWIRRCVKKATISMLKEGLVYDRYSSGAKNPKAHCHSMHTEDQVLDEKTLSDRLVAMESGRPLRFVYFGRFVPRKGLVDSLKIIAAAKNAGVELSYDLIGDGPQRAELESLVEELSLTEQVKFLGSFPYGLALHEKLRGYDALLFTPTEEDTPRMVYDAYASGLPLITSDIAFLRHRANKDKASIVFGVGDIEAGCSKIMSLNSDRKMLADLSLKARALGKEHSVEQWYGRRLDWTIEAVERFKVQAHS